MVSWLGNIYAWIMGWPALAMVNKGLFYLAGRALGLQNFSWSATAGERRFAAGFLKGKAAPVVFDVGANEGAWLRAVLGVSPAARIHAFEPQPRLAEKIRLREPRVQVTATAVGSTPGVLCLHDYADHPGSSHASLVGGVIDQVHRAAARSTEVPVIRLDDYCRDRGITRIDLLKIDVEGFELEVLRGAAGLMASGAVDAIQFEFNEMNVIAGTFMRDFKLLLGDGYRLYRLLPHGLLPLAGQSHWFNEQFVFQNVVALKRLTAA